MEMNEKRELRENGELISFFIVSGDERGFEK